MNKSVVMICKILVTFMCVFFQVYCESSKETIAVTETFFNNLIKKYELSVLTNETRSLIDQEVDDFINSTLKNIHVPRHKKQLPKHQAENLGVEIFDDLKVVLTINTTDVSDLYFFKKHDQFFKVVVTSTDLIVYQIYNTQLILITYHPVPHSSKLHVCKFRGTIWFIVKHSDGFTIFHFFQRDGRFFIDKVQNIDVTDIKHFSVWRDQTHMFLSVSSTSTFRVYSWLEGFFRLIDLLATTVDSSAFIAINESINLIVLEHRKTTIRTYTSNEQSFAVSRTISKSFDCVTTVHVSNGVSNEYLLALSNRRTTILYKLSDDTFAPFQEIAPADQVVSVVKNTTVVLFLVNHNSLSVYQYDGWRFVQLNYELGGIEALTPITWRGEEHLIAKHVNGSWMLAELNWSRAKVASEHQENLWRWCMAAKDRANKMPTFVSDSKPIEVSNVNLHKITVDSVNGISVKQLKQLNEARIDLASRLQAANDSLTKKRSVENLSYLPSLRAKIVRVQCSDKCHVSNLVTELPFDVTSRLGRIDDETLSLKFEKIHVDTLEGFPCPVVGLKLQELTVKGSINGVSFEDLHENALRTSGDQVVTANHVFDEIRVTSLIAPNIEAASTYTRQRFKTKEIHATELNLIDGGLLLPLDGEPVTMTGTLTAKKVTFNKLVTQRGRITGESIERIAPMALFQGSHELTGNYTLGNVKVTNLLKTKNIARKSGKSLKDVIDKAIPLNGNVPVHLEFSTNRTIWTNITVGHLPNWLTRNNAQMVTVTGKKIAFKNIALPDLVYAQLPIPKIKVPACTVLAITPDLRTSSIRVGRVTAKTVEADDVEGARDLDQLTRDCVTSWDEVDLSKKIFTGPVFVDNLNLTSFEGSPFESFETAMFKWYEPQVLKGPITLNNLNVSLLNVAGGIKVPLPSEVRTLVVQGNLQVKTLNGIDLDDFLKNVVRINESIELNNVVFEGSVEASEIETTNTNIHLGIVGPEVSLGNTTIIGDLEIEGDFSIPDKNVYSFSRQVTTYVIDGSVRFKKEPDIANVNAKDLKQLMEGIWLSSRPAKLSGNFHMSNVTLSQPFNLHHLLSTPNFGPWETVENRVLSKTKLQTISSTLNFRSAKIPNVITRGHSVLNSSDPYLNDLLYMTLKKNAKTTISDQWHFQELVVAGDLILEGQMNNLNLSTDVGRHDVKVNIISGKKTVKALTAKHLRGLNFDEWAKDALMQSASDNQPVVVTGRKTFGNLQARIMTVNGTVMGKQIDKCLTKYGDQIITASKFIKGSLNAASVIVKGSINDMNFTDVALNQLRKSESLRTFGSDVTFVGNLNILGNVTFKTVQGVDTQNTNSINDKLMPLIGTMGRLKSYATAIETLSKNRAKYWCKFKEVPGQILPPVKVYSTALTPTLYRLGNCVLVGVSALECNERERYHLKSFPRSNRMLVNEILSVNEVPVVVQVSSGSRSRITIYRYDYVVNTFDTAESIRVPGITDAAILNHNNVVWIVTLLKSEMLVLRYETWGDLRKYRLPPSSLFALDIVQATDEPILVRDDGMWKLDGLAGPRNTFKADLICKSIDTFHVNDDFVVRLTYRSDETKLLKATYVGV